MKPYSASTARMAAAAMPSSSFMSTLEKYSITANRKTITIMEPVSPESRMIRQGTPSSSMMWKNSFTVLMGRS